MATFELAYKETVAAEGGWSDHPSDKGGQTWRGIARNKNPSWHGWKIIDSLRKGPGKFPDNLFIHPELHRLELDFYKKEFWDKLRLDEAHSQDIAKKLFDIAVNCGQAFAAEILQRSLNVSNQRGKYFPDLVIDGKVGPKTIAALNAHPRPEVLFKCLNVLQGQHYIQITERREANEDFLNGWFMNRIAGIVHSNPHDDVA